MRHDRPSWAERVGLPLLLAFAAGVLVASWAHESVERPARERDVLARVDAALARCTPPEVLGGRSILVWDDDGRLSCTRVESITDTRARRTHALAPVLSQPVLERAREAR